MRTKIKSRWWEWTHSFWLLWTITVYFNWVAFLYIGLRVRRTKWILWAFVYALPIIAALFLVGTKYWESWPGTVTALAFIVMSILSLVHALKARRRYLLLLAVRQSLREAEKNARGPAALGATQSDMTQGRLEMPDIWHPSPPVTCPEVTAPAHALGANVTNDIFYLQARVSYLIATNIGGMVLGSILLLFLTFIRGLFTPVLYLCFIIILLLYLGSDSVIWWRNGIRMIEIDSAGLTLRRGPAGRPTVIPVSRITGVEIFDKLGRKVVNILTGGSVAKMLGITLISGPHVRIACDAFNGHEFEIFIQRIRALAG